MRFGGFPLGIGLGLGLASAAALSVPSRMVPTTSLEMALPPAAYDAPRPAGLQGSPMAATQLASPSLGGPYVPLSFMNGLPEPSGAPLTIDFSSDPVLRLGREMVSADALRALLARVVTEHAVIREAKAGERQARAARGEARSGYLPTLDITLLGDRSLARDFGNDPENVLERIRPKGRVDALASVQQNLFDFGATGRRIAAAGARLRAASAEVDQAADQLALNTIAAWYDVLGYQALVDLGEALAASQRGLRDNVAERVRQGVASQGDVARVETYVATAEARLARFRRALDSARMRYQELAGTPPPSGIGRPQLPDGLPNSVGSARAASASSSTVIAAEARAAAARQDWRAAKADNLPKLSASIDAGRYGVFETDRDYDVRGRLVLRQRLFGGGGNSRAKQAEAEAAAAAAVADRIRDEAARDAAIAFSDVDALQRQLKALDDAYRANRRSRDVLVARFQAARGTLYDVLAAEDQYFEIATEYIRAVTELDAARYVLLSRTGQLLPALGISVPGGRS